MKVSPRRAVPHNRPSPRRRGHRQMAAEVPVARPLGYASRVRTSHLSTGAFSLRGFRHSREHLRLPCRALPVAVDMPKERHESATRQGFQVNTTSMMGVQAVDVTAEHCRPLCSRCTGIRSATHLVFIMPACLVGIIARGSLCRQVARSRRGRGQR